LEFVMAGSFKITLSTPTGKLIDGVASSAAVPAHDGSMGFLPGRMPILFKLGLGTLSVTFADNSKGTGGGTRQWLVEDGFAQMVNDKLTILTTRAIPADQIDVAEAQKELSAAVAKTGATFTEVEKLTRERDRARLKVRLGQATDGKGI
jgi:F-type H+-transporting ATPase subunit epsilon